MEAQILKSQSTLSFKGRKVRGITTPNFRTSHKVEVTAWCTGTPPLLQSPSGRTFLLAWHSHVLTIIFTLIPPTPGNSTQVSEEQKMFLSETTLQRLDVLQYRQRREQWNKIPGKYRWNPSRKKGLRGESKEFFSDGLKHYIVHRMAVLSSARCWKALKRATQD